MYENEQNHSAQAHKVNEAFIESVKIYIEDTLNYLEDHKMVSQLTHLLKKGANPNIYLLIPSISEQPILLFAAAIHISELDHFLLSNLLLNHGANAAMPVIPIDFPLTGSSLTSQHLLPIQKISELVKRQFYSEYRKNYPLRKLFHQIADKTKQAFPWVYDEIHGKIQVAYEALWGILYEQAILARQQNLQLMVLVGETHESVVETIINILLVMLTEQFNINNIMIEHTQEYASILSKSFSSFESKDDPYLLELWSPGIVLHVLAKELGKNVIGVDVCKSHDHVWNVSEQGVNTRNQGIATELIKYNNTPGLGIFGWAHLSGLSQDTNLGKYYHVFVLDISSKMQLHELFDPAFIALVNSFLTPVDAAKLTRNACEGFDIVSREGIYSTPLRDAKEIDVALIDNITINKKSNRPT